MFERFASKLHVILATGFSPEVLALRNYFEILLQSISGDKMKPIELDAQVVDYLKSLQRSLSVISLSNNVQFTEHTKIVKGSIDLVV